MLVLWKLLVVDCTTLYTRGLVGTVRGVRVVNVKMGLVAVGGEKDYVQGSMLRQRIFF